METRDIPGMVCSDVDVLASTQRVPGREVRPAREAGLVLLGEYPGCDNAGDHVLDPLQRDVAVVDCGREVGAEVGVAAVEGDVAGH